ncbi:MAG: MarR family transcriptional regulator [Myxococcales bacterium]|nr:MarR family transcriptional regulator [Myxococcales bacterium]
MRFLRLENGSRNAKLSTAQLFVLVQLNQGGSASIRELAERTMTDPSSVSVVVSKLATRGLVARTPDPGDKRRVTLRLTATGKRAVARAKDLPQVRMAEGLAQLPLGKRRQIAQSLELLVEAVGADDLVPRMFLEGNGDE